MLVTFTQSQHHLLLLSELVFEHIKSEAIEEEVMPGLAARGWEWPLTQFWGQSAPNLAWASAHHLRSRWRGDENYRDTLVVPIDKRTRTFSSGAIEELQLFWLSTGSLSLKPLPFLLLVPSLFFTIYIWSKELVFSAFQYNFCSCYAKFHWLISQPPILYCVGIGKTENCMYGLYMTSEATNGLKNEVSDLNYLCDRASLASKC